MRTLIVEDDFIARTIMQELLKDLGPCHVAVNGVEAVRAVSAALAAQQQYDVICLDIMMPEMDGQSALLEIRKLEEAAGFAVGMGAKVIITTALADKENIMRAFRNAADTYLVKPIEKAKLLECIRGFGLVA
jgi:two-component system, chemotaxis family, chemotaxis protein CheY